MEQRLLIKDALSANSVTFASRGVRLNGRELLFQKAKDPTRELSRYSTGAARKNVQGADWRIPNWEMGECELGSVVAICPAALGVAIRSVEENRR